MSLIGNPRRVRDPEVMRPIIARMRANLTYANVVASLALFLALGGVSYAATKIAAGSVGTEQLREGAVTSSRVKNGSLLARDFDGGELPPGPAGAAGQNGKPGAPGPAGPKGEPGASAAKGATGPSGAVGPAGPEGPMGPAGAAGPEGPVGHTGVTGSDGAAGSAGQAGAAGPQGPTGIVSTARLSGFIAATLPQLAFQFIGGQAIVTTSSAQRLTASAMAPVGVLSLGALGPQTIQLDFCYQPATAGGSLTNFSGPQYSIVAVTLTRTAQAVAATVLPGAGTWRVGVCAVTPVLLDNNDFVNGYVQVTN